MKADIIRDKFLEFFKSREHRIIESDSLVPTDDPTVLFTPAGMNQFKREFLGFDSGFKRAATSQRCLRTDDLEKVGLTTAHHTFFEMLGNFSFGDYFKEDAITWAWEFLTKEMKLEENSLWVSVYKDDDEAYAIWKDLIKVPKERIVKLGDKENFWPSEAKSKGPNGPCGPCSEIFFDLGEKIGCGSSNCTPACDCQRFVEVWNLVFTQFNRMETGLLEPLPQKNIDTGMGLERLAAVMQKVKSNFETDLFAPIIDEIMQAADPDRIDEKKKIFAVADHIRAVAFAIYDGVLPSNEARGYVIRKLIRRSVLHLRRLGIEKPFLYKLVPVLSETMKRPYPELEARKENISGVVLAEEKTFIATLKASPRIFEERFAGHKNKNDPEGAGRIAFQLYDTYGIPIELTKAWLDKKRIIFSVKVFEQELSRQRERSKLKSGMKGDVFDADKLRIGSEETQFSGYKDDSLKSKIIKIMQHGKQASRIDKGDQGMVVLEETVFYPESGGQVGDSGLIKNSKNLFEVADTRKAGKMIMHIGRVRQGSFKVNDPVEARIDSKRRLAIARNHTATHLLQAALRKVLGEHVRQQGSLVAEDRLRFDFTHFKDIRGEELDRIEEIVNEKISADQPLDDKKMSLAEAKKAGALAFFAEKYQQEVRVVSIEDFSSELCAGTHLKSTGEIQLFRILHEGSIASGIRRIEAATGSAAQKLIKDEEALIKEVSRELGVQRQDLAEELKSRLLKIKEIEKELSRRRLDLLKGSVDQILKESETIGGKKVVTKLIDNLDMNSLRKTVDMIKQKTDNTIIILGGRSGGKALLVIGVTEGLVKGGVDASSLIAGAAKIIGGSGGGRKDFAQAGGSSPENFAQALAELKNTISKLK
ncbi:alanine--tRNA ligase [Candidatus Omnitrophota bacterium]